MYFYDLLFDDNIGSNKTASIIFTICIVPHEIFH